LADAAHSSVLLYVVLAALLTESHVTMQDISIFTPNLHYLPCHMLGRLGESFDDDVFIPTNEPSGTISCTVGRH
jgi:hypothetical protein